MKRRLAVFAASLMLLGAGCVFFPSPPKRAVPAPPVGCTKELKICPDGTGVGRTGPNCEFDPCPAPQPQPTPKPEPEPIACTQDAMQCPDGSYVSRVPPRCEFAPCPAPTPYY